MKTCFLLSVVLAACRHHYVAAFSPVLFQRASLVRVKAGGFEWEDPGEVFDQGVENPFKNPGLMKGEEGMKIDPARLLGPRLNGSNLYLVGLMGTGGSETESKCYFASVSQLLSMGCFYRILSRSTCLINLHFCKIC